ncbi:MAG: winged helix-turn-helix domain-containing protein [Candidatus Omnitrophica bacterium]|nr:winged helix-turn-helix domain-containing protein [Candidatus Omnitrophota bacterium]
MLPANLIKIVEFLFRNIPNKFNVNQIARELKISVGSAYKILKSLEKKGVFISQRVGNGIYYVLDLDNKGAENITELVLMESRNEFLAKNPRPSIHAKDLKDAEKLSKAIILFGSILDTKDAKDVDVLFIIDKGKSKAVEDFCMKLSNLKPKRVNPLFMTMADFKANIKKQDKVIVDILRKGIILFGEDVIINILRGV